MQRTRIFFIVTLVNVLAFFYILNCQVACAAETKKVKVLTSFYPMYIMALNVTKDIEGVSVADLTPPATGCLHDYALTTNDMKKIADADIFVANGAGMESFLDKVIMRYPKLKVIKLAEGVAFIKDNGEINPHVWVSVSNAITEVKNLGKTMEEFDPLHAELYKKNTAAYVNKLETLREEMHSGLNAFKGKQIITFHEAFPYFAQEFGFKIVAVIERNPGSEPSAKELAETVELVKKAGIRALFGEPQYPAAAAKLIAKETGAKVYILDPAVTGPDDANAYIDIMKKNLEVLIKAFE